ncbi:bifunctional diaminohydroxyphosphoribosylaminopyrimidine deaminase/5-amino-6-(5-phosphoribosylamino)uracil reductase RibD [Neptuniibacter caesariensis]|uniref:Riboflavin biosynthesis protein RibD n=1 Tax=Neptuniibacter caesariensis TaxID=207954 RepID=A0A7U8C7P8_NEPCE|nr:bifunctional diaminohydroxyphosphoribosylaminopyrimidine deaminase/5-amino-6-(5-phosphoribosylamino)uracil reductase RibD [Neptuniibacter caesariensis]EAR61399.1 riboflavin biosynthesis protein RibD [Oceanospirillum sp. MED92] [Neptuniibacter caesariensis]
MAGAWSIADHRYMARAIVLAKQGLYTTNPNPRVGCVLVKDEVIVGEGFHFRAGEGHAEVNAMAQAGDLAKGATAYVTLEPCSHYGRTPPCAEGLIKAGVNRVVCAMVDPNPQVAGRGIQMLESAGISAESGLLEAEARALNPGFIKRMETGLPFVSLKIATSLDGRTAMASGESKWITGAAARSDVQKLRARSSAILTGVESILTDNSALTVRAEQLGLAQAEEIVKQQPLRVVLDSNLRTPIDASILSQPGRTLIATISKDAVVIEKLQAAGAEVIQMPANQGRVDLVALLKHLAGEEQCNELLVETGATLAGAFIDAKLVDQLHLYMAMTLMGSSARPAFQLPLAKMSEQVRLKRMDMRMLGDDMKLILKPLYGENS